MTTSSSTTTAAANNSFSTTSDSDASTTASESDRPAVATAADIIAKDSGKAGKESKASDKGNVKPDHAIDPASDIAAAQRAATVAEAEYEEDDFVVYTPAEVTDIVFNLMRTLASTTSILINRSESSAMENIGISTILGKSLIGKTIPEAMRIVGDFGLANSTDTTDDAARSEAIAYYQEMIKARTDVEVVDADVEEPEGGESGIMTLINELAGDDDDLRAALICINGEFFTTTVNEPNIELIAEYSGPDGKLAKALRGALEDGVDLKKVDPKTFIEDLLKA